MNENVQNLYIVWEDKFNLGVKIIDEQHRAIVSTINTYHYFVMQGKAEIALQPTLVTLGQYAKTHFMTEESILEDVAYPDLESHKTLHAQLLKSMLDIAKEASLDKDYDIVLTFLRNWWLDHIGHEDAKYATYVKGHLLKGGGLCRMNSVTANGDSWFGSKGMCHSRN